MYDEVSIKKLPPELFNKIWSYLDLADLKRVRQVNTCWKNSSSNRFILLAVVTFKLDSSLCQDSQIFSQYIKDYTNMYRRQNFMLSTYEWRKDWKSGEKSWLHGKGFSAFKKNAIRFFKLYGKSIKCLKLDLMHPDAKRMLEFTAFFRDILHYSRPSKSLNITLQSWLSSIPTDCSPLENWNWDSVQQLQLFLYGTINSSLESRNVDNFVANMLLKALNVTCFLCDSSPWFYKQVNLAVDRGEADKIFPKFQSFGSPGQFFRFDSENRKFVQIMSKRLVKKLYIDSYKIIDLFRFLEAVSNTLEVLHVRTWTSPLMESEYDIPHLPKLKELVIYDTNNLWQPLQPQQRQQLDYAKTKDFFNLGFLFKDKNALESRLPGLFSLKYLDICYRKGVFDHLFPRWNRCRIFPQIRHLEVTYPNEEDIKEFKSFTKRLARLFPNVSNAVLNSVRDDNF